MIKDQPLSYPVQSPRLNILIVTDFSLDDLGGVATMVQTLEDQLADCRFIYLQADWDAPRRVRMSNKRGRPLYLLRLRLPFDPRRRVRGFFGWAVGMPAQLRQIRELIRGETIDVIHLHFAAADQYIFAAVRLLMGTPYILTLHGSDVWKFGQQRPLERMLIRIALRYAATVVGVSSSFSELARRTLGVRRISVVPNGIDIEAIERARSSVISFAPPLPARFCLVVSNVMRRKAQDVVIRAWAEVHRSIPDLHLVIVGRPVEPDYVSECEQLAKAVGDVVHFWGGQSHEVVIRFMRLAEAVIFPSRAESFGYVLGEAAIVGAPVICSDLPAFLEIVEHDSSALVTKLESHGDIANAVIRLSNDQRLARSLAENLSQRVREQFSAKRMAEKYSQLYLMAIKKTVS